MHRLSTMKNQETGEVCWIAAIAKEYYSSLGIEYGMMIRKLAGWGNAAIFTCGGKRYAVNGIADGIGVIPAGASGKE